MPLKRTSYDVMAIDERQYIGLFGILKPFFFKNGSSLVNVHMWELFNACEADHVILTSYYLQGNSQEEATNKHYCIYLEEWSPRNLRNRPIFCNSLFRPIIPRHKLHISPKSMGRGSGPCWGNCSLYPTNPCQQILQPLMIDFTMCRPSSREENI